MIWRFEVGVGVVLAGAIVVVLAGGLVRGELFEPGVVIVEQAVLGVVDVNAGGDVCVVLEREL